MIYFYDYCNQYCPESSLKNSNKTIQFLTLSLICIVLSACASPPESEKVSSLDKMINDAFQREQVTDATTLSATAQHSATQAEISAALLPNINLSAPGMGSIDVEPRFDIKVNRANIRQFFMGLVDDSSYNMILHPEVTGRITLDLKNVTVTEVMEVVRDVYGYDFEQTDTAFSVFPNTLRTRVFNMNYLNVSRDGDTTMSVSTDTIKGGANSGSNIKTSSKSAFWEKLEVDLNSLVGKKEGRQIIISPQSGIVIARAMPHELRSIEKFISRTQNFVKRQVIIKAKILEVELNKKYQTGINWSSLQKSGSKSALIGQTGGGSLFGGSGLSGIAGNSGNLDPSNLQQITGTTAAAFGGMFSLALNFGADFAAFIELLKNQGEVHVLSSPQVSSVNNQKAVIKVGKDEFFITNVTSSSAPGLTQGTTTTQSNATFTPFFSGVALDVMPQISDNGEVILHVHPTVSSVTEKIKTVNASTGTALSVPLAVSSIRESDSIIRAKSGQVVIIGGLMQNTIEQNTSQVPLLGDIPLLGALFRHTQDIEKKSELVILLKPIVINSEQEMEQQVQRAKSRIKHIRTQ